MSTRAQVRFATREDGVSFSEHPEKIHAQFYKHSDGYPEGLGLDIADSIMNNVGVTNWEIEHVQTQHGDLEYIYYIWSDYDKETWISIFEVGYEQSCECCGSIKTEDQWQDNCIFVGKPKDLITKYGSQLDESHYKLNTNDDG
jgi:hypothetical protein|tara:strand:- start:163 stop:591 length:429 start_codon:yes stop_codon:yes gene_type:complete